MKLLIYFVLLVMLWVAFFPAFNVITHYAPTELQVWYVVINVVITCKLLIDLHTTKGRL